MAKHAAGHTEDVGSAERGPIKAAPERGRHAAHAVPSDLQADEPEQPDVPSEIVVEPIEADSVHLDRGGADVDPESLTGPAPVPMEKLYNVPDQRKSRRTRTVLIVLIVVIVLAIAGVVGGVAFTSMQADRAATDQAQTTGAQGSDIEVGNTGADGSAVVADDGAEVPNLSALFGLTVDEATSALGNGAEVAATSDTGEEGALVVHVATIELPDYGEDTATGTPTVYLGVDADGIVVEAAFSAGLSQLGYASMSFADAVKAGNVIENSLTEAGLVPDAASIVLPDDAHAYTTYADDGATVREERYSFTGTASIADAGGPGLAWTVTLEYDYPASAGGADTSSVVRRITVSLAQAQPEEPPAPAA